MQHDACVCDMPHAYATRLMDMAHVICNITEHYRMLSATLQPAPVVVDTFICVTHSRVKCIMHMRHVPHTYATQLTDVAHVMCDVTNSNYHGRHIDMSRLNHATSALCTCDTTQGHGACNMRQCNMRHAWCRRM